MEFSISLEDQQLLAELNKESEQLFRHKDLIGIALNNNTDEEAREMALSMMGYSPTMESKDFLKEMSDKLIKFILKAYEQLKKILKNLILKVRDIEGKMLKSSKSITKKQKEGLDIPSIVLELKDYRHLLRIQEMEALPGYFKTEHIVFYLTDILEEYRYFKDCRNNYVQYLINNKPLVSEYDLRYTKTPITFSVGITNRIQLSWDPQQLMFNVDTLVTNKDFSNELRYEHNSEDVERFFELSDKFQRVVTQEQNKLSELNQLVKKLKAASSDNEDYEYLEVLNLLSKLMALNMDQKFIMVQGRLHTRFLWLLNEIDAKMVH